MFIVNVPKSSEVVPVTIVESNAFNSTMFAKAMGWLVSSRMLPVIENCCPNPATETKTNKIVKTNLLINFKSKKLWAQYTICFSLLITENP